MRRAERGLTLIELIMAILVASGGIAVITYGFVTAASAIRLDEEIQTATRHAQDCAENILGMRRAVSGYSVVSTASPSSLCSSTLVPLTAGYTLSVARTSVTLGQSAACPSTLTGNCSRIDITAGGPDGYQAAVSFMIVNY